LPLFVKVALYSLLCLSNTSSGSRDGGILLWDLRTPSKWSAAKRRMQLGPIMRIDIATAPARQHRPTAAAAAPGSASKQGRPGTGRSTASRGAAGAAGPGNCRRSVTSLLFVRNEHTMISSSDMDGVVKLWDLRRLSAATGDITLPPRGSPAAAAGVGRKSSGSGRSRSGGGRKGSAAAGGGDDAGDACWMGFSCPSRSSRPAGISSMALSPAGAHTCGMSLGSFSR
jgi:WD40 repeat protein